MIFFAGTHQQKKTFPDNKMSPPPKKKNNLGLHCLVIFVSFSQTKIPTMQKKIELLTCYDLLRTKSFYMSIFCVENQFRTQMNDGQATRKQFLL